MEMYGTLLKTESVVRGRWLQCGRHPDTFEFAGCPLHPTSGILEQLKILCRDMRITLLEHARI